MARLPEPYRSIYLRVLVEEATNAMKDVTGGLAQATVACHTLGDEIGKLPQSTRDALKEETDMARLDDIQGKHDAAMACFIQLAELSPSMREALRIGDAIAQAKKAFAQLLQHHKTFKGAVATAHEIERAKQ